MLSSGVSVALGTDGAASNNRLDMWGELRTAALLHKGVLRDPSIVTAREILDGATYRGYRALGFEKAGLIREGWKADLVLVDLDGPNYIGVNEENLGVFLVYAGSSSDVAGTMVDGSWIYIDGEFPGQDEEEVLSHARKARAELIRR
jgi:5-methylthioadenosine/S-adenosylhomocysteine deaminase